MAAARPFGDNPGLTEAGTTPETLWGTLSARQLLRPQRSGLESKRLSGPTSSQTRASQRGTTRDSQKMVGFVLFQRVRAWKPPGDAGRRGPHGSDTRRHTVRVSAAAGRESFLKSLGKKLTVYALESMLY